MHAYRDENTCTKMKTWCTHVASYIAHLWRRAICHNDNRDYKSHGSLKSMVLYEDMHMCLPTRAIPLIKQTTFRGVDFMKLLGNDFMIMHAYNPINVVGHDCPKQDAFWFKPALMHRNLTSVPTSRFISSSDQACFALPAELPLLISSLYHLRN